MKKKNHYLDNKQFLANIKKYYNRRRLAIQMNLELPKIPEIIGKDILKISQEMAKKPNFYGYSYKEEMIADGYETSIRYFHNFDPEKSSNPFGYFSKLVFQAFLRYLEKEKKQSIIKSQVIMNSGVIGRLFDQQTGDAKDYTQGICQELEEYINTDLIEREMEKKKKAKEAVLAKKRGPLDEFIVKNEDTSK